MKYLPNQLSLARLALAPYVFLLIAARQFGTVLILFGVAGLTDALDGFIARRWHAESRWGAYLDPIADKFLLSGCFLTLAFTGDIAKWLAALVVGRDVAILLFAAAAFVASKTPKSFPPTVWGKASTAAQILFVLSVIAQLAGFLNGAVVTVLEGFVAALTTWSAIDYARLALKGS